MAMTSVNAPTKSTDELTTETTVSPKPETVAAAGGTS